MSRRDDFSTQTVRALALRAGHHCSMPGCGKPTAGPSDASPEAVTILGIAAHIAGAAPEGPRFDPDQTRDQRRSIDNGIWLCCDCATMVDRDATRFTVEVLAEYKRRHEANRRFGPKGEAPEAGSDLIAIGPDITCIGELTGASAAGHELLIRHFLSGESAALFDFVNRGATLAEDKYVLINELGEGFLLRGIPSIRREGSALRLTVPLAPRAPRSSVHDLGSDFAQDETGDWFAKDGDLARVAGLEAFPQRLGNLLGLARGESFLDPHAGARVGEYYRDFGDSPWLKSIIKLEVIRLSAIPRTDRLTNQAATPLECVERVRNVELPSRVSGQQRLTARMTLDLSGHGLWEGDVRFFVHTPEQLAAAGKKPDWFVEALAAVPPES